MKGTNPYDEIKGSNSSPGAAAVEIERLAIESLLLDRCS